MGAELLKDLLEGKRYPTDLIFVIVWAIISIFTVLSLPDGNILRVAFGIPLLLLFPGYGLISILWPENGLLKNDGIDETNGNKSHGMGMVERIVLSLGLSIVILSILGIALGYSSFLITFNSVIFSLFFVVMAFGTIAVYLRIRLPLDERFSISLDKNRFFSTRDGTFFTIITLLVALVVVSAVLFTITPSRESYTNFYILDGSGSITNLSEEINVSDSASFIIGIVSHESNSIEYTLNVSLEDSSGQYLETLSLNNYSLESEESIEVPMNFSTNTSGTYRLVFDLTNTSTGDTQRLDWSIRVVE